MKRSIVLLSCFAFLFLSPVMAGVSDRFELKLTAPITTWDEAIPLGIER